MQGRSVWLNGRKARQLQRMHEEERVAGLITVLETTKIKGEGK